ncbi:MAG TPA: PilZ domain-containing protein [Deltaproteobacteria bacterium]|nr:PilZ domain-containing protein [Deltaproteobacteria bacterium]HOI07571.1 PilZ domain-containing protein [Deltaproteobacteria bacterium]
MKKEKRRSSRKLLRIEARYQDADSKVLKGVLRNISLSGVYIETVNTLALQSKVHLSLDATDLGKVIDVAGTVVRVEENKGMGIEFDDSNNRDIRLLLSSLRKLDQASMLALSRSGLGDV